MRKIDKLPLYILCMILIILFVMPGVMGLWVRHSYFQLIAFYNAESHFKITVKHYSPHWYSADVLLRVEKLDLPQVLNFDVKQHVQYGPFILTGKERPILRVATVHSEFQLASTTARIVKTSQRPEPMLSLDDNISFLGVYHSYFHSTGFKIIFPTGEELQLGKVTGEMIMKPLAHKIKGQFTASDIVFTNPQISIVAPLLSAKFNKKLSQDNLWLGSSSGELKSVSFEDVTGKTIKLSDISTHGMTNIVNGRLAGNRQLTITTFQINDILVGPLSLKLSVKDLCTAKTAELLSAYQKLIFSTEKMAIAKQLVVLFPNLITSTSTITLDDLKLVTIDGNVDIHAQAAWPQAKPNEFQTPVEFLKEANAHGSMRISTSLAKQLLTLAADLRIMAHRMSNPHLAFIESPKTVDTVLKQNSIMMALLVQSHDISVAGSTKLIQYQNDNVPLEDYDDLLNALSTNKEVSPTAKKLLHKQYQNYQLANLNSEERLTYMESQFADEFYAWVKQGFIQEEGNDYVVTVSYDRGNVLFNGQRF